MNENHDKQPNHKVNEHHRKLNSYDAHRDHRYLNSYDEEFATDHMLDLDRDMPGDATSGAVIFGFIGLAATVIALFNGYSFILGSVGIALGCYAVAKGAKMLGITTIGIGLLAVVVPLFYNAPFMSLF